MRRILTEKHLDGYRRANNPAAFMGQPTPPADSNARNVATQLLIDGLKAKWTRAPEIIVARNMQDAQIPQAVRDYDALLKSQGATGEPRGFIYQGVVYLLSDQLKGPKQIAEVLFHEVLGHYGLRGAFGDGLTPILKQLGALRRKEVVAKAREYGLFNKDALGGLDKTTASDSQIWAAMSAKNRLSAADPVSFDRRQCSRHGSEKQHGGNQRSTKQASYCCCHGRCRFGIPACGLHERFDQPTNANANHCRGYQVSKTYSAPVLIDDIAASIKSSGCNSWHQREKCCDCAHVHPASIIAAVVVGGT